MKERLTGAIILVALIVLLVPELLTGPPQARPASAPSRGSGTVVPPVGHAAVHSYTLPMAGGKTLDTTTIRAPAPARQDPTVKAPAPPARTAASKRAPTEPGPARISQPPAKRHPTAPQPRATPRTKPVQAVSPRTVTRTVRRARPVQRRSVGSRWVVQLGVFAVHGDALRLERRVRSHGIPVRVAPLRIGGRRLWRVSTGVVRGRAAGLALDRRLRGLGLKGELLRQ